MSSSPDYSTKGILYYRKESTDNIRLRILAKDQRRALGSNLEDSLGKDGVRPREPGTRVLLNLVDVDGLVDQTEQARVADEVDAFLDLFVGVAGHGLDQEAHWPDALEAGYMNVSLDGLWTGRRRLTVRAADAADSRAGEVVGVALSAEEHLAGVPVNAVILVDEAEDRQGEDGGDVGVIHDDARAVAVDLEGEDLAVLLVLDDGVFPDRVLEVLAAALELARKIGLFTGLAEDLGGLLQLHGHHGVRGSEESKDGGVVAGTEGAADETGAVVERSAVAVEDLGLGAEGGLTVEGVLVGLILAVGVEGGLGLLVQDIKEAIESLVPSWGQELGGAGVLVEVGSQGQEVGQRVELVLAFEHDGILVGWVDSVLHAIGIGLEPARRRRLERVAVGRLNDELDLRLDRAQDEAVQVLVLVRQQLVAGQLVGGVTEPLGVDVAGYDEGLRALPRTVTVSLAVIRRRGSIGVPTDGGVQSAWESIAEQLSQVLVHKARGDVGDDLFDLGGREGPTFLNRALGRKVQRTAAVWAT